MDSKVQTESYVNPFLSIRFIINLVSIVCCLCPLFPCLKRLPTPLADSENYVCRGLCQEDVLLPKSARQLLATSCFLVDRILEFFPAAITSGVEKCVSHRAACQAHRLHGVPESVYQTNTFHQKQSIDHSVLYLLKVTYYF